MSGEMSYWKILTIPLWWQPGSARLRTSAQFSFPFSTTSGFAVYSQVFCSPCFGCPISKQRERLRTMTLRSCASLSWSQTLVIGHGRPRVALGSPTDYRLQVS